MNEYYLIQYEDKDCGFLLYDDNKLISYLIFDKNMIDKFIKTYNFDESNYENYSYLDNKENFKINKINFKVYMENKGINLFVKELEKIDVDFILGNDNCYEAKDSLLVDEYWGCFSPSLDLVEKKLKGMIL